MATPTKILQEDPEKKSMGIWNSKKNGARVSDLCKDHVDNAQIIDSETLDGESALNRVSDDLEREEIRVSNPSTPNCGRQIVSVNDFDAGVVANGFSRENNCETNSTDEDEKGDRKNNFRMGDFVWGKIKTHMWWPGRVSGFANQDKGRVSVAFFECDSFSSCSSSELIPFADKFSEISKVSDSRTFVNAVNRAVDELSMLVELNMSCKCVRQTVENQVVIITEADSHHLSIPRYKTGELLGKLTELATRGEFFLEGALEIAILKSQLSPFYYFKGGYALPVYCEPCRIEGLEEGDEKDTDGVYKNDDLSVPMQGPREDDWLSTPSDSRVSRKRKEKSVAELFMSEENENIELENRKRKRKVNDNYYYVEPLLGKRKEFQVADDEDLGMVSTPRERKKSKYLSPPYIDLMSRIGDNSSFKTESKVKHDKKKLSDVDCKVDELLSEIHFAAVDPFYLSEKGPLDSVRGFIVALKSKTFLHGSNYKMYRKCKSSRYRESHLNKVIPPLKRDNEEHDASCSADDLISDAGLIKQKVKILTAILENYHSRFGVEDILNLKDDLKLLMEKVERVSEKVRVMAENTSS